MFQVLVPDGTNPPDVRSKGLSLRCDYSGHIRGTPPGMSSAVMPSELVIYHSADVGDHPVHHNTLLCRIGSQTSVRDIRLGDDGRPLCRTCVVLSVGN
jgi:hypothetical protein